MRGLRRNKIPFWYCLYLGDSKPGSTASAGDAISGITVVGDNSAEENWLLDDQGFQTGEQISRYSAPKKMYAYITTYADGRINPEAFGAERDYDKVIITSWKQCPIDEFSVLFVDKGPEYTEIPSYDVEESDTFLGDDTIKPRIYKQPKYDYRVRGISRSLNGVRIMIQKVAVT